MDRNSPGRDDVDRLRADRDEWRRRAEVAEAVAAERLARAETAERALAAAEAALTNLRPPAQAPARSTATGATVTPDAPTEPRPRSLIERWRRYTDTIN